MRTRLIRNATLRITYGGRELLLDPFLSPKHTLRSFAGLSPNPLVDLPYAPEDVINGVEAVILSHLHIDHFDPVAEKILPKRVQIFCQPGDEKQIAEKGFRNITPIVETIGWLGITITRLPGRHGTGELAERMGKVSGFVFQAIGEPTVYWASDTVWYGEVQEAIARFEPAVIVTHSSGAKFGESDPIVMDAEQTIAVCQNAPWATVVAIHLESLDHGTVTRAELRAVAEANGIRPDQLLIPADGEQIMFSMPNH